LYFFFIRVIRADSWITFLDIHRRSHHTMPMRRSHLFAATIALAGSMVLAVAQTTQPAPARDVLNNMLKPAGPDQARPLQPIAGPAIIDATTGVAAVAPNAPQLTVMREGSYVVDRTGRLKKGVDGQSWELTFEADGKALKDPPVLVLPNLKLQLMEDQLKETRRDLKFRVTGMVTEYRGRNYVMLDKVIVISE